MTETVNGPAAGWEAVIGIEVHVELMTRSKMFCGCRVRFGQPPNTDICPTCLGLPGALPVPNRTAIEWITRIGLALDCEINQHTVFHRKNYYYADLPKNYQISQYDIPVCRDGHLDVDVDGQTSRVGIERAHQEEDTGKSIHVGTGGRIHAATETLLDFNRSGVPLVEIVSKPEMHSAAQARAYAQTLREVILELKVSDARLEEGSMRFDANVSVRKAGNTKLGTKVEVKNMNSFRSLERAVAYEIDRQVQSLEDGREIIQETRHWDESGGETQSMRTKEGSSDYRYFTEPDLVPMVLDAEWQRKAGAEMPELPSQRRGRYRREGVDSHASGVLASADEPIRRLYDDAVAAGAPAGPAARWSTGEVTAWVRKHQSEGTDTVQSTGIPISGTQLTELIAMVGEGKVSSSAAKEVLDGVMRGEGTPGQVAQTRDLVQISDSDALRAIIAEVLDANVDAIERVRSGDDKPFGFLVGQVMRATGGKADPSIVSRLIREAVS